LSWSMISDSNFTVGGVLVFMGVELF
jgi:hypothetical protein